MSEEFVEPERPALLLADPHLDAPVHLEPGPTSADGGHMIGAEWGVWPGQTWLSALRGRATAGRGRGPVARSVGGGGEVEGPGWFGQVEKVEQVALAGGGPAVLGDGAVGGAAQVEAQTRLALEGAEVFVTVAGGPGVGMR
jgi:hypothetical protein